VRLIKDTRTEFWYESLDLTEELELLSLGKQIAETVLRFVLKELKAFMTFDLNRERLLCFSTGSSVVAGGDVDVGFGFGFGFGFD
jgi:hypothetical protein